MLDHIGPKSLPQSLYDGRCQIPIHHSTDVVFSVNLGINLHRLSSRHSVFHNNNPKFTREATISILALQFCLLSPFVYPRAKEGNVKGIFILTFDDRWGKLLPV